FPLGDKASSCGVSPLCTYPSSAGERASAFAVLSTATLLVMAPGKPLSFVSATRIRDPPFARISPTGFCPTGTSAISALFAVAWLASLEVEKPSTSLLCLVVSHSVLLSFETAILAGLQPAGTLEINGDPVGSVSALPTSSTLSRPSPFGPPPKVVTNS